VSQSDDFEYRKAASKYSASYMSNAKWLKLFRAVISTGVPLERVQWKFIDTEHFIECPSQVRGTLSQHASLMASFSHSSIGG
jgi:hypothetical protein